MKLYIDGYLILKMERMTAKSYFQKEIPSYVSPNEIGWGLVLKKERQADISKPENDVFESWYPENFFNERLYQGAEE